MERKRIFIGLLAVTILLGMIIVVSLIALLINRDAVWMKWLLMTLALVVGVSLLMMSLGTAVLIYSIMSGKIPVSWRKSIFNTMSFLFPLVIGLSEKLGFDKSKSQLSYIAVNNFLVRLGTYRVAPSDILLLAPHCLQNSHCEHKVTINAYNCKRCGRCRVSDLLALADEYGVNLAVVTGGTLARKMVKQYRPRAIVAIACERDLSSGIVDVSPLPTLGVLNQRPFGPCVDTCVEIPPVREALEFFLQPEAVKLNEPVHSPI